MTNEQFQQWLKVQERQIAALERIAQALEAIKPERPAPNYKQSLKNFPSFDWASIDAEVEKADRYGAAVVVWGNKKFVRRSPENAYGTDIFFTRCTGKDEAGKNKYERLITFSESAEIKVRPISREAESVMY